MGIGQAIARRLAEAGCSLILLDRDASRLATTTSQLSTAGVEIQTFAFDLSSKAEIDQFWTGIPPEQVDILVNNAGFYPFRKFLKLDEALLEKVMHTNFYSVLWMCQAMIAKRIHLGGKIINMGSIEAIMPFKRDLTQYSLSKVGVITLTRDLAREFAGKNFNINAILPGGIQTPGTKGAAWKALATLDLGLFSDAYNFRQRIPAGRFGDADEVARMVVVLASDLASYVHGALLPVDGGFLSS